MPVTLLGSLHAERFDVAGARAGDTGVITHVALVARPMVARAGDPIDVHDMCPPLNLEPPRPFIADVVGSLPLTRDEQDGIDEWLSELLPLARKCSYIAMPAARERRDEFTHKRMSMDFSCAGFVVTAYQEGADIMLVEQGDLPALTGDEAYAIWGPPLRMNSNVFHRARARVGLTGEGPWRVLTPGHVLHALARGRSALPYRPSKQDLTYP